MTPETRVQIDDATTFGNPATITGVVRAPTPADVDAGRRQLGADFDDGAVLVEWETFVTRWEFTDTLRIAA